jgi:uncharacterized protein
MLIRRFFGLIADHPVRAIIGIALVTAVLCAFIPRLTIQTNFRDYLDRNDPTVRAMDRAEARFGSPGLFMVTLVNEGGIFNAATLERIAALQSDLAKVDGVDKVTGPLNVQVISATASSLEVGPAAPSGTVPQSPEAIAALRARLLGSKTLVGYLVSANGTAASISIELKSDADEIAVAKQVVRIVDQYNTAPDRIFVVGLPYMNLVLTRSMVEDLWILLPLVFVVIVAILYLSFFSVRGVFLPLGVVTVSTAWTLGLMGLFGVPVTLISFILPVILMAIGIAYGIHVLNHFYEAARNGVDRRTAVIETGVQMIAPVAMAGLTTVAGFLSLLNSFLVPQRQFGVFAAVGVLAAMALALVLIPALLSVLPMPPKRRRTTDGAMTRVLSGLGQVVLRHRRWIIAATGLLFVAFLAGLPLLKINTSEREFLGGDNAAVRAIDAMDQHLAGSEQVVVEIDTAGRDGLKDPAVLRRMLDLEAFLHSVGVKKTTSLADVVEDLNQKFHSDEPAYGTLPDNRNLVSQLLFLFTFQGGDFGTLATGDFSAGEVTGLYPAVSSEAQGRLAREVQAYLDDHFTGAVRAEMVGVTRLSAAMATRLQTSQITSLTTSIVASGLIVSLLMGSLLAGLISLIPLCLTVVINFGVMAYSGTALDLATLMVSSVAIGIGIDYAIHFMSRFRRETAAGVPGADALHRTIRTAGRGIAYNALALALGFAVLLASSFKGTRHFGLLIAMTMAISSLSAFTVIPAVLVTWRPRFLRSTAWGRRRTGRARECGETPEKEEDHG